MNPKKIAVIGGGISGIAAAYFLQKKGYRPHILEAESSIGGRAGSIRLDDKLIDIGGKNIGRKYSLFRHFIDEMGSHELEFFGINSSTVLNGKLITIDSEKKFTSILHLIQLVGFINFLKFARLALIVRKNSCEGFLDGPYFSGLSSARDHRPITHYFSSRFNHRFLRPIVIRMNGSEPQEYYIGNFGSNIKMVLDKYDQLKSGMSLLFNDIETSIPVLRNTRVERIITTGRKVTGVTITNGNDTKPLSYDGIFMATPAGISSILFREPFPALSEHLHKIRYNPVTLVVVRYKKNIFNPSVRAIVFDRHTALSNAGCYGINDLNIVRYTFSGHVARRSISENSNPSDVIDLAEKSLNKYIPVSEDLREKFVYKHFNIGLCAYAPFHHQVFADIQKELADIDGLGLTGDYVRGASLEACFQAAKLMVETFDKKMKGTFI